MGGNSRRTPKCLVLPSCGPNIQVSRIAPIHLHLKHLAPDRFKRLGDRSATWSILERVDLRSTMNVIDASFDSPNAHRRFNVYA